MELEWMGRYRELIRALVYYSNSSNRSVVSVRKQVMPLSQNDYQILEHICEFENERKIMADISRELGILPSIVTKSTKHLSELGLIEKFHMEGNRKSIILRPTESGKEMYRSMMEFISPAFNEFFKTMAACSNEELALFEAGIRSLGNDWGALADSSLQGLEKIN